MGKNIDKKEFEYGLMLAKGIVPDGEKRALSDVVCDWLYNSVLFEPEYDTDYEGCFIELDRWNNPDEQAVLEWLEGQAKNPEARMAEFEKDGKLSNAEKKTFKEHIVEDAVNDGDYPGVFVGTLECQNKQLFVYTTRQGHSFEGIEVEILGLFLSRDEAEAALFTDGELH